MQSEGYVDLFASGTITDAHYQNRCSS